MFELEAYEVLDERFYAVRGDVAPRRLFDDCRWAEGPVYVPAGRYLLFSDIPNDRVLRWDETSGSTSVFREPASYANGHTLDPDGRVVSCEHGSRQVTRTEHDGSVTVVADNYRGARLNSPNDVTVSSDGAVWFTDSSYGIDSDYEGNRATSELDGCFVFRVDPANGQCEIVADDFQRPTGIAFSADEDLLYVADSRANHIRRFDVKDGASLIGGEVFAANAADSFDGVRVDADGRVWVAASDGVQCFDPDGTLLGKIVVAESAANIEFGGRKRNRLFICASTSLYSIGLAVNGVPRSYRSSGTG